MGLLDRSSFIQGIIPKGLLSTAELIRCTFKFTGRDKKNTCEYPFSQLHALLNSYGVLHFGLYVPFNNQYEMVFNHGFDYETTLQGSSSADFWRGTFDIEPENNTWYTKSDFELDSFLQLFSANDRNYISALHIKFFSCTEAPKCIIVAAQQNTSSTITDHILDSIDDNFSDLQPFIQYIISHYIQAQIALRDNEDSEFVDTVMENCIINDLSGYMLSVETNTFFDDLIIHNNRADASILMLFFMNFLLQAIPENSVFKKCGKELKLILFSDNPINFTAYKVQLLQHLDSFFYLNSAQKLRFTLLGISQDTDELIQFMKQ